MKPFDLIFRNLIRTGSLTVIDADGAIYKYVGRNPGPAATMKLATRTKNHKL